MLAAMSRLHHLRHVWLAALAMAMLQPAAAQDAVRASGAYHYNRHCAECHGADGRGTLIGFPLVGRPAGPLAPDAVLEALRFPLQSMPRFSRDVISDDVARLIAFHIGVLENRASGAAVPAPPEVDAAALHKPPELPPPPQVAPAPAGGYEMREYPSDCGPGAGIAVAPDGRVWYAALAQNALAVFTPHAETFRCWPLPTRNARPHGIAADREGFVFATLTGLPDNKIAMFDPRNELFVEYQMPSRPQPLVLPHTIITDAERNPLFTLEYADALGRIDRRTGAVQALTLPSRLARPTGITIARNGHVMASLFTGNRLFDYDPKTGKTAEHAHPRAADDPGLRDIASDSRGQIWATEYEFGGIAVFDPRTQRWKSFRAPANGGEPRGVAAIAVDARDNVWFTHHGGNYIGRFDPRTESFAVYPHVTRDMNCRALEVTKENVVWCVGSTAPVLMKLTVK